jgi:pimeloyl-ACP methyl ester carboxylesterase
VPSGAGAARARLPGWRSAAGALLLVLAACAAAPPPEPPPFQPVGGPSFVALPPMIAARVGSFDGVPIAYWARGAGEPTVVLVHGWAADSSFWGDLPAELETSHRVITIDLGGHGRSGTGRVEWTIAAYARDVDAVVRALDLGRVALVGQGMGGAVALAAAVELGERCERVVTVAAFDRLGANPVFHADTLPWSDLERDFAGGVEKLARTRLFSGTADPALVDRVARSLGHARGDVALASLRAWVGFDPVAALASAAPPVIAIESATVGTTLERRAPRVQSLVWEDDAAFPQLEQPTRLLAALRQALATPVAVTPAPR